MDYNAVQLKDMLCFGARGVTVNVTLEPAVLLSLSVLLSFSTYALINLGKKQVINSVIYKKCSVIS